MNLRWQLLGLREDAASFSNRGFATPHDERRRLLELHGRSFIRGYNAALDNDDARELGGTLGHVPVAERGFAYEGAGMAWALLDRLLGGRRLLRLLSGPGRPWRYLVHVGSGWAMGRLRLRPRGWRAADPLYRWLALDGWGFHDGYFKTRRAIEHGRRPGGMGSQEGSIFDQGLGRSLWFVGGADVACVTHLVGALAAGRRPDLWSGVGLACVYAGGLGPAGVAALRAAAGPNASHFAQGAAFAAKARLHAGHVPDECAAAVVAACGHGPEAAAQVTDDALAGIRHDGTALDYQAWRRGVRTLLAQPQPA